ncbi:MAG: hypothetical protein O3A93_08615 [Chloroflexi bacterium]|nr:hypothetical protein [Chloroflexota bacterium]MDA1271307.1 hypothetical protein [Chloroflexota bacterium]PKB58194.1 MAG: hypothetical protein BZY83_08395 [SAR202 cluster bacterium Casp-Chloro-G2]
MALQESPLQTGATVFVERHGYRLPAVYSGFAPEYEAATTAAAIHDASYMGRLKATGEDGLDLLNRMSTNKVVDLGVGEGAVTVLTTDRGRIIDVLGVVNQGDYLLLLTSPGRQQAVMDWLDKYTIMEDLEVEDITPETAMLALVGPGSARLLGLADNAAATVSPDSLSIRSVNLGGHGALAIEQPLGSLSRYWLIVDPEAAAEVWQHLTANGAVPVGTTAMDAARVNHGVPEYGPELGEPYNPLEAGLIGSVDFTKGCYIGQEVIARLDSYKKVQRYLVSLSFDPEAGIAPGDALLLDGQNIGAVTSVAPTPSGGALKGLGYVKAAVATIGARLDIGAKEKASAEIVSLAQPFGPAKN